MTRKSVNMLTGTVSQGATTEGSMSTPGGNMNLCPISRVARIPSAYSTKTVSTRTQNTPCTAAKTPVTNMYNGLTDFTSFTSLRMRMSRSIRINMMNCPRCMCAAGSEVPSLIAFKNKLANAMSHESTTELMTMMKSNQFQDMSGLEGEKKKNPFLFRPTMSSNT